MKSYKPNGFGLYDMHGNVAEWCEDWFDRDYYARSEADDPPGPGASPLALSKVVRGGGWSLGLGGIGRPSVGRDCRSAARAGVAPDLRVSNIGFRVALVPELRK